MDVSTKDTLAQTWRRRVGVQQASGQSIRDWCRTNGCQEHTFYVWRARLGLSPVTTRKPGRRTPPMARVGFAKIILKDSTSRRTPMGFGEPMRLSLIGGRELMLPSSMPVEQIARLVRAIEGAA
jgi:hypothetical protein